MRILANENFPGDATTALAEAGHDLAWIRTDAPGSSDRQVLQRAQAEERVLITFDKDFGELAFRAGLPASSGIVLFRISAASSADVARVAVAVLGSRNDWAGHFSVKGLEAFVGSGGSICSRFGIPLPHMAQTGFDSIVPGLPGAHTQAASLDELQENLKEVIELCLEEHEDSDATLPRLVGLRQIEILA